MFISPCYAILEFLLGTEQSLVLLLCWISPCFFKFNLIWLFHHVMQFRNFYLVQNRTQCKILLLLCLISPCLFELNLICLLHHAIVNFIMQKLGYCTIMCNFVINSDTLEDVEKCWETMRNIEIYNFQKFPSDHVTDITDYRDAIASKK